MPGELALQGRQLMWLQCLRLAARLALERVVPKPLQAFLRVATAAALRCYGRAKLLKDKKRGSVLTRLDAVAKHMHA